MNKIVVCKKIAPISRDLSDYIYKKLNDDEKNEVRNWLSQNKSVSRQDVIWFLYITESQRRRMNPRLVEAVEEYCKKHPKCNLGVVDIPNKVKKIQLSSNGTGELVVFDTLYGEDIKLWKQQISVKNELERNEKEVPTLEVSIGVQTKENKSIWVKVKRFFRKLKRNLFYRKKNRWRDKSKSSYSNKFKGVK